MKIRGRFGARSHSGDPPPALYDVWLDPEVAPESARELLQPYDPDAMATYPVSTVVNNPRNDTPDCVERLACA